jgi:hypothetical protein
MGKPTVTDTSTKRVEKALSGKYLPQHPRAKVDVYRYNSASIRVRIIDPDFEGKSITAREAEVLPIVRDLSGKLQDQITMLLLITPEESNRSLLSAEFDDPRPSSLL